MSSQIAIEVIFISSLSKYERLVLSFSVTTPLSSVSSQRVLSLVTYTFLIPFMSLRGSKVWASFFPVIAKSPLPDVAIIMVPSFLSAMLLTNEMTDSPAESKSFTF